jgi:hypothetical protein
MPKLALVAALLAVPAIAAADDPLPKAAPASTGACFEAIVLPAARLDSTGILRINKCSGESWLLMKTSPQAHPGREAYEWMPILVGSDAASHAAVGAKCFVFNNKQYCE